MSHWPRLAALAVVVREGRLLLVRRRNEPDAGLWGFPGGSVEPGETVFAAAIRELAEETTVMAEATAFLTNLDIIRHDPEGRLAFHFLLVAVRCDWRAGEPEPRDDVHEAAWFLVADVLARTLPMSADVDTVLRLALARG